LVKLTQQGLISPTFYVQLLSVQIPKMWNDSQAVSLFSLLESTHINTLCIHAVEIDIRMKWAYIAEQHWNPDCWNPDEIDYEFVYLIRALVELDDVPRGDVLLGVFLISRSNSNLIKNWILIFAHISHDVLKKILLSSMLVTNKSKK